MDSKAERILSEIERKVNELREHLRLPQEPSRVRWARQMLSVLAEIERRGGHVSQEDVLEIGQHFGYQRQGMAGFYQALLRPQLGRVILTQEGKKRLDSLRRQYEELP